MRHQAALLSRDVLTDKNVNIRKGKTEAFYIQLENFPATYMANFNR